MNKKAVSGMMLTLLLIGMLTSAFNIQRVKAEPKTWTVDDDGPADFHTIQEATNAANPGDKIFVYSGRYLEHLTIDKNDLTLIGEHRETTIIDGNITGTVIRVTGNNNQISGFTICNGLSWVQFPYRGGISLEGSGNIVTKNNIENNIMAGVSLYKGTNNTVSNNNLTNNRYSIWCASANNTITDNYITSYGTIAGLPTYGVYLDIKYYDIPASGNVFRNNSMVNNTYNFRVWGLHLSNFIQDIDPSNTVDGKPIYYWINRHDEEVPSDAGYIALINCTNIIVRDVHLKNNVQGVLLAYTNNSLVQNVKADTQDGIYLIDSCDNVLSDNDIMCHNGFHGITLFGTYHFGCCVHNTITNNNLTLYSTGIALTYSSKNTICGNTVTNNHQGILVRASNNTICDNTVANNYGGIAVGASNNTICGNTVTNNHQGILVGASNNFIYHNNFVNNTSQVRSYLMNAWDDGYPSGGNYWSDYTGVDLYSGPCQNETGCDGIGDTPYVINENNQDTYPLMEPWSPVPTVVIATVDVDPDTLNLRSRGKWITCYIELPEGNNVSATDVSSVKLNDMISAELKPVCIGDEDRDGIPDLMVKFDRAEVTSYIFANVKMTQLLEERFMTITLTVTGYLNDGTPFQGSDTIRIIMSMLMSARSWRFLETLEFPMPI